MIVSLLSAAVLAAPSYTLHEWGTFTSVAGADGTAIIWRPLATPSDLPSFVYTMDSERPNRAGVVFQSKASRQGNVRMETPVLYFYPTEPMEVSLKVGFRGGTITEWYPWARSFGGSSEVDWGRFTVLPNARVPLPTERAKSHYYPARNVDAATVRVCSSSESAEVQHERFLFYRGVGTFTQPLTASLSSLEQQIRLAGVDGDVLVFQRRGASVALNRHTLRRDGAAVPVPFAASKRPPDVTTLEGAHAEVLKLLLATGLYEKEATAMLETWKDSWFEDGLRVISLVPRQTTDELLPLTVSPAPRETVRVLVGRMELLTSAQIETAKATIVRTRSLSALGRFAEPLARAALKTATPSERAVIEPLLLNFGGATNVE